MARRFLLPLLAFALFTTEAATAQTAPATTTAAQPYKTPAQLARAQRRTGRTLTARERRQAEAAAKAAAKQAQADAALTMNNTQKEWSGWSDEPLSTTTADPLTGRPRQNLSVAPGMPLNQVGHGVTTDYDGHPINRTPASTTMASQR